MFNAEELAEEALSEEVVRYLLKLGECEGLSAVILAIAKSATISGDLIKSLEEDQWLRK